MKRSQSLFTGMLFVLALVAASFAVLAFAAAPVANAGTIVYDFTPTLDGNGNPIPDSGLQGWTVVFPTSGNLWENYGEWGWMPDDGHLGAGWEDANTELGRSPEFTLDGSGTLTFTLFGSASPIATPVAPSEIPEIAIVDGGFMGVALRDIAADEYVLSARLPANNYETWTTLSFSADDLLPYVIPGAKYTLDFVDYNKFSPNGDGWQIMGEVSIPGVLVPDPTWNGGAGTAGPKDGPGTWNTEPGNTIWFDVAPMAWTDGNPAVFGAGAGNGAAGTVAVAGTVKPTSITFNTTGDGGAYRLTQGIDGLIDLDGKVVKVTANVNAEIATTIANGGLDKLGGGTLTLSGASTDLTEATVNAGRLTINAGTLATLNVPKGRADLNSPATATTANVSGTGLLDINSEVGELNVSGGRANLNSPATATTANVSGTGLLALAGTVGELKVTGGTVNVDTGATAAIVALPAQGGTAVLYAPAGQELTVDDKLTQAGGVTVTAGATPFKVAGSNVVNKIDNLILQGGTTTIDQLIGNIAAGLDIRAWHSRDQADGARYDMPTGTPAPNDSTFASTIGYATGTIDQHGTDWFTTSGSGVETGPRPTGYTNTFTVEYRGKLYIPANGTYSFATSSDDGSALWIDPSTSNPLYSTAAVQNWFDQGDTRRVSGQISLDAGYHDFIVRYCQGGGGYDLRVEWDPTGGTSWVAIPGANYFHGSEAPGALNLPDTAVTVTSSSTLATPVGYGLSKLGALTLVGGSQLTLSGATTVSFNGLAGNGSVVGTVIIPAGGEVSPGASIGAITVSGLTLDAGSLLTFDIASTSSLDQVIVTGTGGLTINGGAFTLLEDGTSNAFADAGTYNLIGYNTSFVGDISNLAVVNTVQDRRYNFGAAGGFITLDIVETGFWNGGGGADANWNNAANWNDIAPQPGDVLSFRTAGGPSTTLNNNLDNGRSYASLRFDVGAPAFTLDGNSIKLAGEGIGDKVLMVNNSTNIQTVSLDVELGANGKIDANSAAIVVGGNISGDYSLTKTGAYTLTLSGDNSHTGGTIINAGNVVLGSSTALGTGGNLTMGGGSLDLGGISHTVGDVSVTAAAPSSDTIGHGGLTANSYDVSTADAVAISADLGGSGGLNKSGGGILTLTGTNTYAGSTNISAGSTLQVDGSLSTGTLVTVPTGATLGVGASGNIARDVTVSGGDLNLAGTLAAGTTLTLNSGLVNVGSGATVATATLKGGTVNAGTNALAITDTLEDSKKNKFTWNPGAGDAFLASGDNLRDPDVARTITLTGGTMTLVAPPAGPAEGSSLWLNANDTSKMTFGSGNAITAWASSSGTEGTVTGNGSYTPDVINGHAVVRFTNSEYMSNNVDLSSSACTIFAVERFYDGDNHNRIISAVNNNWLFGAWYGGLDRFYFDGWVNESGITADTNPHMYEATIGGSGQNSTVYVYDSRNLESVQQIASNQNGTQGPNGLGLNNGYGGGGGGERSNADVAEVLIYNGVLTAEQRAQTEAYLIAKYWGDGWGGIGSSSSNFSTTGIAVTANSELALPAVDCTLGTVKLVGGSELTLSGATKVSVSGLTGNGSVVGTVTIPAGGMVSPGASIGTITTSGLTLDSGSFLTFEIASASSLDQVIVTEAGGLTINGGGIYLFEADGATQFSTLGVAYSLIGYNTSFVGDLANLYVENKIPDTSYRFDANGTFITLTLAVAGYWNGGGTDPNWSTAANWNNIAPVTGDILKFRAEGSVGVALNNDLDNSRSFASLQFDSAAPAFTLDGNSIRLTGGGGQKIIMVNNSANVQTVNMDVELKANGKIDANSADIAVGGDISGGYSLTKIGGSQLTLSGDNSYTGGTIINAGNVLLGSPTALAGGNLTLGGGSLDLGTTTQTVGAVSVTAAAGSSDTIGHGGLIANSYAVSAAGDVAISADLGGGSAGLAKSGAGTLTLSGSNSYAGLTSISAGTLKLGSAGALPVVDVTVNGTLDLNDNSPTIKALNGAGTITTSGSSAVALTVGDGDSDGTFSGKIKDGMSAATVNTYELGAVGAGTRIEVVNYPDNMGNLVPWIAKGTLPEGSILRSVSANLKIDAADYDSWASDFLVYVDGAPEAPGTAALMQVGGNYSGSVGTVGQQVNWANGDNGPPDGTVIDTKTAGNWSGDIDLSTAQLSIGNNYGPATFSGTISVTYGGTVFPVSLVKVGNGTLTLSGNSSYSGGTTIAAGTVNHNGAEVGGSDQALGSGTITMLPNTTLSLNRSVLSNDFNITDAMIETGNSFGSVVSGNIVVTGTATLMSANTSGNIDYTGNISGTGGVRSLGLRHLRSDAHCPVELFGTNNTFEGGVTLSGGGAVGIFSANGLGTGTLRTETTGGTLIVRADMSSGSGIANDIDLPIGNLTVIGSSAVLSGQISGSGTLTKAGGNTLTLTKDSTSFGGLSVNGGTLIVSGTGMTVGAANFSGGTTVDLTNPLTVNTSANIAGLGLSSDTPFILSGSDVVNPTYESHRTLTAQGGAMTISAPPPGTGIVIGGGSGSAAFDSGTGVWTLTGTALNDTGNGFFQYIEVPGGDFDVTVKGTKLGGDSDWNKFGIMARDSLAPNATWCSITDTDGADTSFDGGTNGGKDYQIRPHGEANSAQWIRLQKVGTLVSAYYSFDGVDYTLMTTTDGGQPTPPIDMPDWGATTYLGLTLAAGSQTTKFENVTIAFPALTQLDLSTTNIVVTTDDTALVLPAPTTLGNVSLKGGSLSADQDITMAADFIYRWELDSTAHSVAITGSLAFESTDWDLALVKVGDNNPAPGVEYDLFSYTGSVSGYTAPEIIALPAGWLKPSFTQDGTHIYMIFGVKGDANGDLVVDAADYIIVKQNFGMTGAEWKDGDFDYDTDVDWDDLQILMANFGTRIVGGAPAVTPEPGSVMLLMFGALALLRRRKA